MTESPTDGSRAARLRRRARADIVPLLAFGVFFVAGLVWLLHPWHPVEDLAVTELMVRDVGAHPPLFGAYSSLPFHHPGPLLFLYLWVPYELFGEHSSALLAATIWFNGAVLAVVLGLARRLGGRTLPVLVAGGVLLWARAGGLPRFLQPWNPYVGALPMVALVFLAWALAERRAWALPVAVAVASWAVQAHIQFGPTAAVLGLGGATALVVRTGRADGWPSLRRLVRPMVVAAGVGVVLWLPAIADLVVHGRASNPAAIVRYYRGPQPAGVDRADIVSVLRSELSFHPSWSGGPRPYHLLLSPVARMVPLAIVPILLALVLAWRRKAATELRGLAVGGAALASAMLALTRVTGKNLSSWYLISVEATALSFSAIVAWSLLASARWALAGPMARWHRPTWAGRLASVARPLAAAMTVALVAGTVLSFHRVHAEEVSARVADRMLPAVEASIPARTPVLVEATSGLGGWVQSALVLQLDRAGYDTFAKTTIVDKFPRSMSRPPPEETVRFVVVTNPKPGARWVPGVHVVAEARYRLSPHEPPMHVVVVSAPLDGVFLTVQS